MIKIVMIAFVSLLFYSGCGGGSSPIIKKDDPVDQNATPSGDNGNSGDASGGDQFNYDQNGNQESKNDSKDDGQKEDSKEENKDDNQKSDDSDDKDNSKSSNPKIVKTVYSFLINTKNSTDNSVGINNFNVKVIRDGSEVANIQPTLNQDNSILITSSTPLKVGDVISLEADGFTPQQQIVNSVMLEGNSMRVSLKPIGSRQVFDLGALNSGRITTRISMGASTKVDGENVEFKTNDNSVVLTINKSQIGRMAKRVRRSSKADKNTEIYLDITTIDPKTELESAIGDFTYNISKEPRGKRLTKSANPNDTMLESVVMTSLSMTTSEGDEIHCFDGSDYDETSGECSGDSSATLKMKIPASQFDKYATKYNKGERTIPLYHYSKSQSTWVRQVKDGKSVDGELILEDINSNKVADEGDTLYISGSVGHFSYWNGDYPVERIYLNGSIKVENGAKLPVGTVVVSKGSDYVGRSFRVSISSDLTYSNLGAKAKSKVELYLQYPDGTRSDSIFVDSSDQEVEEVLICDYQMQELTISVVDSDNNPLEGAVVKSMGISSSTDKDGHVTIAGLKDKKTKVTASYDTKAFVSRSTKFMDSDDSTIVLDTKSFKLSGEISFVDSDGNFQEFKNGFVEIYDDTYDLYQRTYTKGNAYNLLLPLSKFNEGKEIHIRVGIFVSLYGKFIEQDKVITISSDDKSKGSRSEDFDFELKPFIVSGKVTNPFALGDQKGIPNITIYSDSQSVQSDENGNYQMLLFYKEGGQKLRAYDPVNGDIVRPNEITISQDEQDQDHSGEDFIIDRRVAKIEGVVINDSGIPIEGLPVYTSVGWLSTTTDSEGKFSFEISKPWLMGRSDININIYDANDNSKLLKSKVVEGTILKGTTLDAGEIIISTNIAPIINSVSWDEPVLNQPMNVYVDAYDPDNDKIKTTLYLLNGDEVVVENGIGTITPNSVGNLEFRVEVKEVKDEELSAESIASMVVSANSKPVIDNISGFERRFDKSGDMKIIVDSHDPEGGKLSFDAKLFDIRGNSVDKLSIVDNSFTISKDIENGRYHLSIYVSDGVNRVERNFKFRADDNVAPKDLTLSKDGVEIKKILYVKSSDAKFDLVAEAKDDNGDRLSYRWNFNDALGEVTDNILTIDPNGKVGVFPITISVTDGSSYISKDITVVIANNLKPIIHDIKINPKTITKVGKALQSNDNNITSLSVEINATDPEGTDLTYKFGEIISLVAPTSDFISDNKREYNISKFSAGRYAFKIYIQDGDSKVTSKRVMFKILENKPPRISSFFVPIVAKKSAIVDLKAFAIDPEDDKLSYKWSVSKGTLSDSNLSIVNLNIGDNSGEIEVSLEVKDSKGNSVTRKRVIKIVENHAPAINQFRVFPTTIKVGKTLQFSAMASDIDLDDVSYEWYWNDEIISQESSGNLQITSDSIGDNHLTLVVSDGSKSVKQIEKIKVEALADKPIVKLSVDKAQILVGSRVELTANVNVPSKLKWNVSIGGQIFPKIAGATFIANEAGTYSVSVVATNEDGIKSDEAVVNIDVRSVALSLEIANPVQVIGNEFRIDAQLSDDRFSIPSNGVWKVSQKPSGSSSSLNVDGSSATITPDKVGTYKVSLSFEIDGIEFNQERAIIATEDLSVDEAHTVHGVVAGNDGQVLEGAKVRLYNADDISLYDQTITTDDSGTYLFSEIPSGRYYLVVSGGDGYINQTQVVVIN